jgi:RimJ/RimL family protein N-acetyltransferase
MNPVALETADLRLREFEPGDLPALHAYDSDPAVCLFQPWGPNDLETTRAYLEGCIAAAAAAPRRHYELALIRKADGAQVGNAGLRLVAGDEAELGFTLRRDAWGRGYATQAARALVAFAFETLGVPRLRALCDEKNAASLRVLAKAGFRRAGAIREFRRQEWRGTAIFVIEARDYGVSATRTSEPAASRSSGLIAAVASGSPTAQTSRVTSSRTKKPM